ncbi:MAG: methyltransferase domain-containing protein [Gammaproteobacteria bacterium]|nr:methyltransferase domain-containing protein [Gammaproteobacteria bacterium]MDH5304899.1 methyltransferase domain-containing protein [Gammaproteobacteria bacterium]MDH5322826.1 methyltransferase domain-containing protein [Gammaproteobacteria bacterium]
MQAGNHSTIFCAQDVRRRFDRAADSFDDFDFVHRVTREGLLLRLEPMSIEVNTVLDLGCATGAACKPLHRRFRGAHIIALDVSARMLRRAARRRSWFSRYSLLQAEAGAIPLANHSVDLVFCNQLLPWVTDATLLFAEVGRVLRSNGLFVFAALGPDSLGQLRDAWQGVDPGPHVNPFPDMHNFGDAAVRAGLRDPVLDVDRLRVSYTDADALFRDLTGSGARNCLAGRRRSLTGKGRFRRMTAALPHVHGERVIELELELVYGHCWGSGQRPTVGEFRISPEGISRRS